MQIQSIVVSLFLAATASASSIESVVAQNYPSQLAAFSAKHHLKDEKQQTFVTIATPGVDYIIAAYSNGNVGAVSLLERVADSVKVNCTFLKPTGAKPEIELQDLDGDGRAEALVRFDVGRGGAETWIYRVDAHKLTLISPVDSGGHTVLGFPDVIDLGRSGAMDLVDAEVEGKGDDATVSYLHYVLVNGSYVDAGRLDFYQIFYREKGKPRPETATFTIPPAAVGKPFHLRVANGGQSGRDYRVAAGTITVNGVVVSSRSDFNESRGTWAIPVTLQPENSIAVQVEGKPKGRIAVVIDHD
jgi:hypothetical protein